jgi:hypothetical protein
MAVAIVMDFPGGTMAQYHDVTGKMGLDGRLPPGALFHAAGSHMGGLRVIDVWEDRDVYGRFSEEQIGPLSQEVGMTPPTVRMVDVDETKAASGGEPVLVQVVMLPGVDSEGFRAADAKVLPDGTSPREITFHVNGPDGDDWCVVDAWTSKEARDRFLEERVKPAFADAGMSGPPQIEDLDVEATLKPATAQRA